MQENSASTEVFKARSGRLVKPGSDGSVVFGDLRGYLGPDAVMDAEEFFQAKRDAELDRWRWPENPEWIVYAKRPGFAPLGSADLLVINEVHGSSMEYVAADDDGTTYVGVDERPARAARAYLDAHPEPELWVGAEVGEIWAVTINGREVPCRVIKPAVTNGIAFLPVDTLGAAWFAPSPLVTAAERIWKADAS